MHERPGSPHFLCTFARAAKLSFIRNHLELSKAENSSAISHLQTRDCKVGRGGMLWCEIKVGCGLFVSI